ncbi:hypothetical protein PF011_g27053 [Phytophthora fragariae]|uniref:Peptidase A2 domain-containing protein n=1 Tax=Phytophthora fragariae TaxID=53985 RepID=A0A6A3HGU5_9STRA|nr:hypothetical protein PF011_g27053 [Phytophthora fragariae]
MAALRYVRPSSADNEQPRQDGGQRQETEEGGSFPTSSDGLRTEEGSDPGAVGGKPGVVDVGNLETRSAVPESEEGVTPSVNGDVSVASGAELSGKGDGKAVDMHGIASVRRVAKQRKRAAKRRRAANAEHRKHEAVTDAQDVEAAVAALDSEQRARREQQRGEAREGLTRRRQQQGGVRQPEDGLVAKVRLVQQRATTDGEAVDDDDACVLAEDGLPTATMDVEGERLPVKLDSGARYSVAGTDWMLRGERARRPPPVDVVEGIGGFVLDVIGVWTFQMRNAYGQVVTVEACIIDGCTDEFLIGVDFLQHHKAVMDFEKNEVRYDEKQQQVVIPFRTDTGGNGAKVAAVRLVSRAKLTRSAVTPGEVAIAAPDGEEGVFVPTMTCGSVMLAATVTTSRIGKAVVPMINVQGGKAKLPGKKELEVWIPLEKDMQVLALSGELDRENLDTWLNALGDTETPLDNEDEVRVGEEDPNARAMVVRLLRAYRDVSKDKGDCPPVTALDVERHIDTGDAAPIMQKRRRHAQMEDAVIENNVDKMLTAEKGW